MKRKMEEDEEEGCGEESYDEEQEEGYEDEYEEEEGEGMKGWGGKRESERRTTGTSGRPTKLPSPASRRRCSRRGRWLARRPRPPDR